MFKLIPRMRIPMNDRVFLAAVGGFILWITLAYFLDSRFYDRPSVLRLYFLVPAVAAVIISLLPRGSAHVLKGFMKAWFHTIWRFVAVLSAASVLLMLVYSAIGYLPYSDRPGPGWGNIPVHWPTLEEIGYFSGWALLLLPPAYFMGQLIFVFIVLVRWFSAPQWLARALGGLFCAGFGMLAVAAAGWYIAAAPAVDDGAGIFAFVLGAWGLPRISPSREMPLSRMTRAIGIGGAVLGMIALLIAPFIR
jgi:hypothetical protein